MRVGVLGGGIVMDDGVMLMIILSASIRIRVDVWIRVRIGVRVSVWVRKVLRVWIGIVLNVGAMLMCLS